MFIFSSNQFSLPTKLRTASSPASLLHLAFSVLVYFLFGALCVDAAIPKDQSRCTRLKHNAQLINPNIFWQDNRYDLRKIYDNIWYVHSVWINKLNSKFYEYPTWRDNYAFDLEMVQSGRFVKGQFLASSKKDGRCRNYKGILHASEANPTRPNNFRLQIDKRNSSVWFLDDSRDEDFLIIAECYGLYKKNWAGNVTGECPEWVFIALFKTMNDQGVFEYQKITQAIGNRICYPANTKLERLVLMPLAHCPVSTAVSNYFYAASTPLLLLTVQLTAFLPFL